MINEYGDQYNVKIESTFPPKSSPEIIHKEKKLIEEKEEMLAALNAVPNQVMIVNGNGQIIYMNRAFLELLNAEDINSVMGARIGEIAQCVYFNEDAAKCGDYEECINCDVANTIIKSQLISREIREECRLTLNGGRVLDFLIICSPLNINGTEFTIASFTDISETKRKKALERIFFHDILNSAGALSEYLNLFDLNDTEETEELLLLSRKISQNLIDEIKSHKQIIEIENGEYEVSVSTFDATDILFDVVDKVKFSFLAENKLLEITGASKMKITADRTILGRVVFNLIKNALEATKNGEAVEMSCNLNNGNVEYKVKNKSVIPADIMSRLFYSFFSTKGKGRGLGLYSIKLLTEKFLKGKVFFESDELNGTVFHVIIPPVLS